MNKHPSRLTWPRTGRRALLPDESCNKNCWLTRWGTAASLALALSAGLLSGCVAPIGADRVSTAQAYAQVEANALRTGKPSAHTVAALHRYELDRLAERQPDEAVRQLHQQALVSGERDLLFALAEMSYVAAGQIRRSVKAWEPRDARDYYLGSAIYAWLFLFGDAKEAPPGAFDRRFREACDFYNYGLGLALTVGKATNGFVQLKSARRRLPVGEIELRLDSSRFASQLAEFDQILLADQFRVRGLSVRNREPGLGSPMICVRHVNTEFGVRLCAPATVLLRGPASLSALASGSSPCSIEVHSAFNEPAVSIGGNQVPLEVDLTTYRAYALTQSRIWKVSKLQFLAPAETIRSQLMLNQPYEPGRVPVVFVHGTFSSPVTWAEMVNSLTTDPVLRQRYQIWSFIYGSGNPLVQSVAELREALTSQIQKLDPDGTNAVLRQMVVIGHSQGGLLTKGTAVDAGDRIWRVFSTNRVEDLKVSETERAELRRMLFLEPLPFVKRVVFVATPQRGSYLSGGFARRLAHKLIALPGALVARSTDMLKLAEGSEAGQFFRGKIPTSLDGMSPENPGLLALADIPVVPTVKAHSIIAVEGKGDPRNGGRDGVVAYESAHLDNVESELVVRSYHTCLDQTATIQEVRRILREHLEQLE
ncbi:MAG: esterase/lipase family protein [Verrucomicrobiia bacterium]